MMKYNLILAFVVAFSSVFSQRLFNSTKKISNAHGTLLVSWGYNRSYFTNQDVQFKSNDYDYFLRGVSFSDEKLSPFTDYFSFTSFYKAQLRLKAAYYYMNRYAAGFVYERTNMFMNDGNQVVLDGYVDSSYTAFYNGTYKNEQVVTNKQDVDFRHQALNMLKAELIRTDKLYQSRSKMIAFSASYGINLGGVISNTHMVLSPNETSRNSFSGYTAGLIVSARLEFFRHLFFEAMLQGSSLNILKAGSDTKRLHAFIKHHGFYGQRVLSLGYFHYFKPGSVCNDCPVW